jgi:RNA polymerase sigma factor (sigma-70 family)
MTTTATPIRETIAKLVEERLRQLAEYRQAGMTQAQIAARWGISQSAVSRLIQRARRRGFIP